LKGKRFALVVARFYPDIAESLLTGAYAALRECGVEETDISVYDVPGCFEIPLACRKAIDTGHFEGVVALGAVVRGETAHFDFVAGECARGIMDVQLVTKVPIGFGVLTTDTIEQARVRADPKRGNKGRDAARAAVQLAAICG
jgi:6,7-dimethyl-8-ribityllumazine synthase